MLPSGRVRVLRRAWCRSISASNPWTSGSSINAVGIALVEDEVQHPHHGAHVAGTLDAGPTDHALGAADALRHGGLGYEVCLSDLACGEATHGAEGQRDR